MSEKSYKLTSSAVTKTANAVRWVAGNPKIDVLSDSIPPSDIDDFWIEITGSTNTSGVWYYEWKRKQRLANASPWTDWTPAITSSSSSHDTRALNTIQTTEIPTGTILKTNVDIDQNGISAYTVTWFQGLLAVYLTQNGGSNGDDGTTTTAAFPTYTYDVFTDAAKTIQIGTAISVIFHRDLKIAVTAATHGLARMNGSTCELWYVDEYRDRDGC